MRWIDLTPRDLKKMAQENSVCLFPIGSLERHGEHSPLGTDAVIAEKICELAGEQANVVVFPTWYWGQVHEAACYDGTINYPPEMLVTMLRHTFAQIAHNGFHKIVVYNWHGGNLNMLEFLDMATLDEGRDYALYTINWGMGTFTDEENKKMDAAMETFIMGHADESETSLYMACRPGYAHLEYKNRQEEPIMPGGRMSHLPGVYSALWWYADYPENVGGVPTASTEEKGKILLDTNVAALVRTLNAIKEDTTVPEMQKEYMARFHSVGH